MMKFLHKAVLRVLLGLYVLAIFKPFLPYLEYALNKSYIIQQLCKNRTQPELNCEGKCYLAQRIKAEETPTPERNPVPAKNTLDQDFTHLRQRDETLSDPPKTTPLQNLAVAARPSPQFIADIFHPPRTSLILL